MLEKAFPSQDYYDLRGELKRLQIEGTYITIEGLQQFRASYATLVEIKKYFLVLDPQVYPCLHAFSERLQLEAGILPRIDRILDPAGEVRDDASENLLRIRSQIRRKTSETQRYIGKYMGLAKQQGWVEEDADVTVRNERVVIPVTAAYKKSMRGFIHDVSSTGQTVFMEPEEIFNLNNEIVELRNQEKLEIIGILKDFSRFLRPSIDSLLTAYRFLIAVDFLRAKARLAILLQANLPVVESGPCFEWRQARHPLLFLTLQKQDRGDRPGETVPLDFCLEPDERIVVISGPNAGGKSVCLKTIGLLQYMMQCGLLVSMREDSRMGVFRQIFVDIGDEQSIENDLSTYSSHLKNMRFWVEKADRNTLFLSDELGSGTEPQVGGAIAESIVENLLEKGAYGLVTTHYTNLKLMAKNHPGIVNGAMLFDQENLRPLYIFRKGLPGSSFAFEIARKIGLPESVLASASRKVGCRQMDFEQELQRLEVEKYEISKKKIEIDLADQLLSSTLEKYEKLVSELESERQQLLRDARDEARDIVKRANAEVERTIRQIREVQAEKEATARFRRELQEKARRDFGEERDEIRPEQPVFGVVSVQGTAVPALKGTESVSSLRRDVRKASKQKAGDSRPAGSEPSCPISLGSLVRIDGNGSVAKVGEIKGEIARVDFDYVSMRIPLSRLQCLTAAQQRQYYEDRPRSQVRMENIHQEKAEFSPRIDIRGMRADEAASCVSRLLDQAVLFGEKHIEILHGKGNGILRQTVRSILSKNPHVADFYDQREEFGGTGVTLAELS